MKISTNWLKDYITIKEDLTLVANKITDAGINIEEITSKKINNLIIGYVEDCVKHPDSDHLNICQVRTGEKTNKIVCGASNVTKGIKVIVALEGSLLPGNFEIKKTTIRGVESNGMICALYELGLASKEETYDEGIHIISDNVEVGSDANIYLGLDDTIYTLDLNPNRNDCLSHIGFAYEAAASLKTTVKLPNTSYKNVDKDINDFLTQQVKTDKCSVYLNKMAINVKVKETPEFIKKRLTSVGIKSINNVVDISNYVMLEYGQPLHFFDYEKLNNTITVRLANESEEVITLDKNKQTLNNNDIVIASDKEIIAIAGVMGSLNSGVSETTTKIVIESAIFDPISIRKTAIKCNNRTDASIRLDKNVNYDYTYEAINRACYLLEKYADADILSGTLTHDEYKLNNRIINISPDEINKLLGISLTKEDTIVSLNLLGFEYIETDNDFSVYIPRRRMDVELNKADIIEEIGRIYGYQNIISTPQISEIKQGKYIGNVKYRKLISKRLRSLGLNETRTYTLQSLEESNLFNYGFEGKIKLLKPMSNDKAIIRQSLIPALLKVIDYNKSYNIQDAFIYEIANVYNNEINEITKIAIAIKGNYMNLNWQNKKVEADFYLLKGIVENILDYIGLNNRYQFVKKEVSDLHPNASAVIILDREEIGFVGKVSPFVKKDNIYVAELNLNALVKKTVKKIKYKEPSKYPNITKDVAFIINKDKDSLELYNIIKKTGGRLLKSVEVFDVYQGPNIEENKKSIAFNLVFEDITKTLTEDEVNIVFNNIINASINVGAKLRDK